MKLLAEIYRQNKFFLIPFAIVFIVSLTLASVYGRVETHIFINRLNSPWADVFFKYFTYLGSGWFLLAVMTVAAIFRGRAAGALLMSGLVLNVLVQVVKRLVGAYRPVKYFELFVPDYQLHLVEGVKMHYLHSFPSGHAATAFAIFFFLAFLTRRNWLKFVYLILAVLVAYSRVYLSQHFLIDVTVGALIGVFSTYLGLWWYLAVKNVEQQQNQGEPSP